MDFSLTDDQILIRDTARSFLEERSSSEKLRAAMAGSDGIDRGLWHGITEEMGWAGINLPEEVGGLGLGNVELALVAIEMGRTLAMSPFFATVALAAPAVRYAGTAAQQAEILSGIAAGTTIASLAFTGPRGVPGAAGVTAELHRAGTVYRLTGEAGFVVDGHLADLLIVAARTPGSTGDSGISLIALPATSAGLSVERLPVLDQTRSLSRLRFNDVDVPAASVLGTAGAAGPALEKALSLARVALAAEQVGGAERCLEITVEFVKQRMQFGRLVGSFQAVKHRLADMMVVIEAAKSAVYYAAATADEAPVDLAEAAAVAGNYCSDVFVKCSGDAIQLHGGVGFTWEYDPHLYFKRARAASTLLGDPAYERETLARLMGLDAPAHAGGAA